MKVEVTESSPIACVNDQRARVSQQLIVWTLFIIGIGAVPLSAVAMLYAGIGWDARIDTGQSLVIRQAVAALPEGSSLQSAYNAVYFTAEFYGILLPQLGDVLHGLVTGEWTYLQLNDIATYRWQGLANLCLAAFAAGCLGFAVYKALRSRLAGVFVIALIMTTPIYFGMSTMNIKDMPVAAGLSMASSGLVMSVASTSIIQRWMMPVFLVSIGSSVAIGTRPGLWPMLLAYGLLSIMLYLIVARGFRHRRIWTPAVISVTVAIPFTLVFLWATNPFARLSLWSWLWDSFSVMRGYPWQGSIRTAGQDLVSTDLPIWYVPVWLLAQFPILTTLCVLAGIVISAWVLIRRQPKFFAKKVACLAPLFVQGLVLPALVIVSGATLYDGIRHLLFMVPALLAISAILISYLELAVMERTWQFARSIPALCALVVVVASSWATLRWAPYSYAFVNPVAGGNAHVRSWELDYWGLTAFEGVLHLRNLGLDPITVLPTAETSTLFGGSDAPEGTVMHPDRGSGLYVFLRGDASLGECREIFRIMRDRQILGVGASC